jgi:hypothetical protein
VRRDKLHPFKWRTACIYRKGRNWWQLYLETTYRKHLIWCMEY